MRPGTCPSIYAGETLLPASEVHPFDAVTLQYEHHRPSLICPTHAALPSPPATCPTCQTTREKKCNTYLESNQTSSARAKRLCCRVEQRVQLDLTGLSVCGRELDGAIGGPGGVQLGDVVLGRGFDPGERDVPVVALDVCGRDDGLLDDVVVVDICGGSGVPLVDLG